VKIGLVAPEFPPDIGGVQTYAWHMARGLVHSGHEVTVFTQSRPIDESDRFGFRIEPVLKLRRRHDLSALRQYRMDVWHCMNAPYAWLAMETAPVFVTVHGNDFLTPYHPIARLDLRFSDRLDRWLGDVLTSRAVRLALPRARHIFANSRYTEEVFLKHHPACRGKTSVASVGVAEEAFSSHEIPRLEGPTRLVTICRLSERRKNLPSVLEALSRLSCAYDFHYTIVGDGELRPELEGLTARFGLADRVSFAGFMNNEQKIELLRRSDLFVLPAVATAQSFEGFGLVYLEANACGTPVLAARVAGAVDAVEEDVSGFFVPEPTVDGIACSLSRFFRGDVAFTAEACISFARGFTWGAVVRHCLPHYDRALAS